MHAKLSVKMLLKHDMNGQARTSITVQLKSNELCFSFLCITAL